MWLAGLRDAAIVFLALESIVIGVLLAITILQIRSLVRLLREEIKPLLDSANDTMSTVKGTTHLVSDTIVNPLVKVSSYATGTSQAIKSLVIIGKHLRRRRRAGHGEAQSSDGGQEPAARPSEEGAE